MSMAKAHVTLVGGISDDDLDQAEKSQEDSTENLTAKTSTAKRRANLQEIENLYFTVSQSAAQKISNNRPEYFSLPDSLKLDIIGNDDDILLFSIFNFAESKRLSCWKLINL